MCLKSRHVDVSTHEIITDQFILTIGDQVKLSARINVILDTKMNDTTYRVLDFTRYFLLKADICLRSGKVDKRRIHSRKGEMIIGKHTLKLEEQMITSNILTVLMNEHWPSTEVINWNKLIKLMDTKNHKNFDKVKYWEIIEKMGGTICV